jgi:predicted peptidase
VTIYLHVAVGAILSAAVLVPISSGADSATTGQQTHSIRREIPHKVDLQYLLFLPKDYETSTNQWPLILYLHGGTPRGEDISQMKRWGLTEKVEAEPNFPFIVVSPQCHNGEIWTDMDALAAILDEVASNHRVDPDRVYVTGHSMGGRGALYAGYKMPDRSGCFMDRTINSRRSRKWRNWCAPRKRPAAIRN